MSGPAAALLAHMMGDAVKRVALVGGSYSDTSLAPSDSTCQYRLLSSGLEQGWIGGGFVSVGTWLLLGSAGDYDARYSPTGDTGSMGGSAINTWLNLATTRTWTITDTSIAGGPELVSGAIEIRDASTLAVLASATLTLSASKET